MKKIILFSSLFCSLSPSMKSFIIFGIIKLLLHCVTPLQQSKVKGRWKIIEYANIMFTFTYAKNMEYSSIVVVSISIILAIVCIL